MDASKAASWGKFLALRGTSVGQDITLSMMWIFQASPLHRLSHSRLTWDSSNPSTKGLDDSSHTAKLLTSLSFELDWRRKRKALVKTSRPKHTHLMLLHCQATRDSAWDGQKAKGTWEQGIPWLFFWRVHDSMFASVEKRERR